MIALYPRLIAAGVAIVAAVAAYQLIGLRAVEKERARVEAQGKKTDAKAQAAARAARDKPDGVLRKYCRDC